MWSLFQGLQYRKPAKAAAAALYACIVERSRTPHFYRDLGVPDTISGRFDHLMLSTFLVFERLKALEGPMANPIKDALWARMINDIEQNLRAVGVSDTAIGKKVKKVVRSFYGRVDAYQSALADVSSNEALEQALIRNLYAGEIVEPTQLTQMAELVRKTHHALAQLPDEQLIGGHLMWPDMDRADPRSAVEQGRAAIVA